MSADVHVTEYTEAGLFSFSLHDAFGFVIWTVLVAVVFQQAGFAYLHHHVESLAVCIAFVAVHVTASYMCCRIRNFGRRIAKRYFETGTHDSDVVLKAGR